MNEKHQDAAGSKPQATENKLWLPPLSNQAQRKLDRLRKKPLAQRIGVAGKTPWDFIQLLLLPIVITGVGYWLSFAQTQSSLQSSQKQHDTDLQIAIDQQRETILKTCLDDIKDLLLNKSLRESKPKDEVRVVARVEILAALRQLNGERKGLLIQFLSEAGLITGSRNDVIIDLSGANLSHAILKGADLSGAILKSANLSGAILSHADLSHAELHFATLNGADLSYTTVSYATLLSATLSGATLSYTIMEGTILLGADLSHAILKGADLKGADIEGTNLSSADLSHAEVTQAQLNNAMSLKGAIMPNGSNHP